MQAPALSPAPDQFPRRSRCVFRPGDLVTTVKGYPILYEIIRLEPNNQVRVRELDWPTEHNVIVWAHEVRPVAKILAA